MLVDNDSKDVFAFWRYHNQCRIHNPVEAFSDGEDLFAYLASSPATRPLPVVLLLDLKIPRMGGLQILERLKASKHHSFPKVLLTETHDVPLVANAYRLGAASFLMKPIEQREFCALMATVEGVSMEGCVDQGLHPSAAKPSHQPFPGPPPTSLQPWHIPPPPTYRSPNLFRR